MSISELSRLAHDGNRPRKDYVELAHRLDADVIDPHYLLTRGRPLSKALARRSITLGMLCEAFLERRRYRRICAWADKIGLPLAFGYKVTRSRRDLVLVSVWLSRPEKAFFLRPLKAHTHLKAIINFGSAQLEFAQKVGVPSSKLYHVKHPVDDQFWQPSPRQPEHLLCSVGWEARDYSTLMKAVSGIDVQVEIAVGTAALASWKAASGRDGGVPDEQSRRPRSLLSISAMRGSFTYPLYEEWLQEVDRNGLPPNIGLSERLDAEELRELYSRSMFAVIPLHDVDADCGVTALTEAMAMGKAVILTRTRGQGDILTDGEQGIYVPPGDPVSLRAAIQHLIDNPGEAQRMGQAGRALVEQNHRLDDYVSRVASIIENLDR